MSTSSSRSGPDFLGLLTLLFIALKLTGYINWSWWLVFSPLLAVAGIVIVMVILLGAVSIIKKGRRT